MKEDLFVHADRAYQEILKFDKEKILIELIETTFPLSLFDYSDLVKHYMNNLPPELKLLKIAVVISEVYKNIAEFWETVCNNKGFEFNAFTSLHEAEVWLTA